MSRITVDGRAADADDDVARYDWAKFSIRIAVAVIIFAQVAFLAWSLSKTWFKQDDAGGWIPEVLVPRLRWAPDSGHNWGVLGSPQPVRHGVVALRCRHCWRPGGGLLPDVAGAALIF